VARVEVPGGVVDVESAGSGPDLVLLHSLLIDRSAFDRVLPALSRSRRVHRVALPGFDGSSPVDPSVDTYADRIAETIRAICPGPGTAVAGNGFGGFIAVALAARHGSLIDRLLVIDAAAGFPETGKAAFRTMAEKVAAGGMDAVVDIAARRVFHDAYLAAHPEAFDERRAVLRRFDPISFVGACRALERLDLTAVLSRISIPTMVLVGEFDAATPVPLARALAEGIAGAEFVTLSECGHCPPLEQPEAFLAAVTGFLDLRPSAKWSSTPGSSGSG
jgi:3-oxoadipate enol-lactonase